LLNRGSSVPVEGVSVILFDKQATSGDDCSNTSEFRYSSTLFRFFVYEF
jgi:hypothetical protein